MKVVVVAGAYPPIRCGTAEGAQQLCRTLVTQGIDVELITTNIPELRCAERWRELFNIQPVVKKWSFAGLPILLHTLDQVAADIVHIEYPAIPYGYHLMINFLPFMLRLRSPSYPVVTRLHEFSIAHPFRKFSTVPLILGSSKVIVPADVEAAAIRRAFPWAASKLVVIPVGTNIDVLVDPEFDRPQWRAKLGIEPGQLLLGYFGMISKSKDVEVLLRAFGEARKGGLNAKLLMIADLNLEKDRYHQRILQLIQSRDLYDEVMWTGFLAAEDVSHYLQSVDAMVLLFKDGVSTRRGSFMAAVAHGLPVITTIKGCSPEGLFDHENVLLVRVGDVTGTANAMKELGSSPELRVKLARNAAVYAERFSWDTISIAIMQVYSQLLKMDASPSVAIVGSSVYNSVEDRA